MIRRFRFLRPADACHAGKAKIRPVMKAGAGVFGRTAAAPAAFTAAVFKSETGKKLLRCRIISFLPVCFLPQ